MLIYSQRDPRWSGHALGWGPALGTIGQYGCFLTDLAAIAQDSGHPETPASLDDLLTGLKAFVRDPSGTFDLLTDNALEVAFPGRFSSVAYGGFNPPPAPPAGPRKDTHPVFGICTPPRPPPLPIPPGAPRPPLPRPWARPGRPPSRRRP